MKRFLLIIAVAALFSSCINEDGIAVRLPDSIAGRQWVGEDRLPDGTLWYYRVWDFLSNKDRLTIVSFKSMDDARMIPVYNLSSKDIWSYDCRYKSGIYTITINNENQTRVYLSDITSNSMILTYEDGFTMNMTPLDFRLTANPVDY